MEATEVKINDQQLQTAWNGYMAVYEDPTWGLKASEEDAVFSMLQAVWPDKYADAKFTTVMRDDERMIAAMTQVENLNYNEPWQGDPDDAKRFISAVLGIVVAQIHFSDGDRVELVDYFDRFPHFLVAPGATGVVSSVENNLLCVKMDETIAGCEEWDNEIVFVLPEEAAEVLNVKVVS